MGSLQWALPSANKTKYDYDWIRLTYLYIDILYLVTLINFNLFYFYFAWLEDLDSEKEDANQKDGSISNGDGN